MTVKKARELLNANITHVSYVDKGANQKKFFLTKSEEKPTFEKEVKILTKSDDAQKLVYGVVYAPDELDAHGDFMKAEEIEKAAHQFLKDARNIDTQHNFENGAGEVVESYVAPSDIQVGSETIAKGTWVLVTKATDEIWESIQKGDITGYSMAGVAETLEVEKAEDDEKTNLFKMLKDFFVKGEVKDKFYEGKKKREFFDALYIFEDFFYDAVWSGEVDKIKEHALDLAELMTEIANSPDIMKSLGDIDKSKEVIKVKKEDLQALLKEELAPLQAKLEALEKAQEEVTPNDEPGAEGAEVQKATDTDNEASLEKEELIKALKAVMKEEMGTLNDRLEAVEKSRGTSKKIDPETVQKEEEVSENDIFKSLFKL